MCLRSHSPMMLTQDRADNVCAYSTAHVGATRDRRYVETPNRMKWRVVSLVGCFRP